MLIDQQQPQQCFTYVDMQQQQQLQIQQQQHYAKVIVHKYKSPNIQHQLSSQTLSRIELLSHCQKCLNRLQQPVTLPCGFTLCHDCLPNSTQCISFSCLRTHPTVDYKPTILIENILSNLDNEETIKSLLDCSICLSTLIEPITTQCGHTFCKECLIKTMTDMNSRSCPFCRTELNRIGKLNQFVNDWIEYLYNNNNSDTVTLLDYDLPLIQVNHSVTFPTQQCLFHTTNDTLLKNSSQQSFAVCVFNKQKDEFYEYGVMLKLNHIEYLPDIRHSVVQATALFRLRIHQLTLDLNDHCYTGDITRLDDLISIESTHIQKRWTVPNTITLTTSTSTTQHQHKITNRPRPYSMRLSTSAPNNFNIMENYNNRRAWGSLLNKPSSPPLLFNTIKKQNKSPPTSKSNSTTTATTTTTTTTTLDHLFNQELHPHITRYLNCLDHPDWILQYEWYLQQSDKNTLIWWIATILPLELNEKIVLLSMETLRERIMTLIVWVDKWQLH